MSEANKALARRLYELIASTDPDALDEVLAADFVDHNPDPGQAGDLAGTKEAFAQMHAAFPDMRVTVEDLVAEGEKVVARAAFTGTHTAEFQGIPATGRTVRAEVIDILRIEGGKVRERWGQYDALGMLHQLGVAPEPASA